MQVLNHSDQECITVFSSMKERDQVSVSEPKSKQEPFAGCLKTWNTMMKCIGKLQNLHVWKISIFAYVKEWTLSSL